MHVLQHVPTHNEVKALVRKRQSILCHIALDEFFGRNAIHINKVHKHVSAPEWDGAGADFQHAGTGPDTARDEINDILEGMPVMRIVLRESQG